MQRVTWGGEVLLPAARPDRLAAWYAQHLGIEPAYDDAEWSAQDHPNQARPSFRLQSSDSTHPRDSWAVDFTVSDLPGILSQLREAGIDVEGDRHCARLRDLESNMVTLWQDETLARQGSSSDESAIRVIDDSPEIELSMTRQPRQPNWRVWVPLLVVVGTLVAALVLVSPWQKSTGTSGNQQAGPTIAKQRRSAEPRVVRSTTGHRLLGISAGWELFGWGGGNLVRLEFMRGRVTRTRVPAALASGGPVSLVVGPNRAIVRGDALPGYTIPDGRPARPLKFLNGGHGPIFRGPEAGQVWVLDSSSTNSRLVLMGGDGEATGQTIEFPTDGFRPLVQDYRGNVLFEGTGGVYLGNADGLRRVAEGDLLAVGPTRLLTLRCDQKARCRDVVTNRRTGAARVLDSTPVTRSRPIGVISPDGSKAAIVRPAVSYRSSLQVIDLGSGEVAPIAPMRSPYFGGNIVFSPDGQWLFAASRGQLLAFDTETYQGKRFELELPQVSQLAIRTDRS